MRWQTTATLAFDIDTGIPPSRAYAITEALCRRIVALLANRDGRLEPLASACLYWSQGQLILLTCRHIFDDGASLGDLALPLGDSGRVVALRALNARFLQHPERDIAIVGLCARRARDALQRHWFPVPLPPVFEANPVMSDRLVVAGYPYAQMRRIDGAVYARPLVFFARALPARPLHASYARTALRVDGTLIHAPELDGVSGATVWAVSEERNDVDCVLVPAGVQCAFKHDQYVRGEPLTAAREIVARLLAH